MNGDLSQLRLALSLICGITTLTAVLAVVTWYRYQKAIQEAIKRSQEVGVDATILQARQRQRSIFLRLSDWYDQTEGAQKIRRQLDEANYAIKPSEYMALRIILALVIFYINYIFIDINTFLAAAIALLVATYIPPLYLRSQRKRYLNTFNQQLIEATASMASAVRAGLSVPQAIEQVSRKLPPPAGTEFRQLSREVNLLGVSVESSLRNTLRRLPSEDLSVVVATLVIQRQAGGNLVKALTQLSDIMRERNELRKEIDTMTAEVRYSAYIITIMPVVVVIFLRNMVPELVEPLFTHPVGWVVLTMFAAAQFTAFILIRRVANIKV